MYAGLAILFFFLVIFLQQVAGYTRARERAGDAAGDARDVRRSRAASARSPTATGRGCSWASGRWSPPPASCSCSGPGSTRRYVRDLLPALLVFSLGLSMTVAPLTATVLADADEHDAGHRLGDQQRDRARRRPDRRLGRSASSSRATLDGDTFAPNEESVRRVPPGRSLICAALVARRRHRRRDRDRQPAPGGRGRGVRRRPARRRSGVGRWHSPRRRLAVARLRRSRRLGGYCHGDGHVL